MYILNFIGMVSFFEAFYGTIASYMSVNPNDFTR